MHIKAKLLLGLGMLFILAGCAAGIPRETLSRVTYEGPFPRLQAAPAEYRGEVAVLGGQIITVENEGDHSILEVVQYPLNNHQRPRRDQPSGGRFRVRSDTFLDPAMYNPGSLVTVVGEVTGSEVRPIGAYRYVYPVLRPIHIRQWEPEADGGFPRFHFGVGVGTTF